MKLPAYPRTKPSGVEWLGDVPEHWDVKSLTRVTISIRNGTSATQLEDDSKSSVPVTRIESISGGWINFDKVGQVEWTPALENFRLKKGDILLSHINSLSMVGNCAIFDSDRPLYSGMNLLRIQPEPTVHAPWLWRVLSGDGVRKEVSARAKPAINQASVTTTQIKALQLPVPPVSEQWAIAAFLERETGRMDRLVARKQELIERLKEKRTALISRTVTRGLPAEAAAKAGLPVNPPLKPSGVPGFDEYPRHWQTKRLRHISDFIVVGVVVNPSSYVTDEGVVFLLGGDVREMRIDTTDCKRCSPESSNGPLIKSRLDPGDIVVVRVGYPGVAAVVPPELVGGNVASMMLVRRQARFCSQWLAYAFNSQVGRDQVEIVQYGAAQKQFNISHAVDFAFPFPPLPEQAAIAAYLDTETAKLDALVGKVEAAVERLQEYRTALITAAVSGKIDVREAVTLNQ